MLLSTAVAGYGFWLVVSPAARPPFLHTSPAPRAVLLHLAGGGLALLLGPWQFVTGPRARRRAIHRWTGRVYAGSVLVGIGGGLVLAPFAEGGIVSALGFGTLAVVTLGITLRAVQLARRHEIDSHRAWMMRSFALIFAAVTLRFQIPLAVVSGLPFDDTYPIIAWLCWVPNLLVAEWMLRRRGDATRAFRAAVSKVPTREAR